MITEAEFVAAMRRRDAVSGLILPWFTHGALDEILTWDLAGKTVLEWGGGASTAWWASKARAVAVVEHNPKWLNGTVGRVRVCVVPEFDAAAYAQIPAGMVPDIVCIDGLWRRECLAAALRLPRPVTIIFDNWQQGPGFIDPVAAEMMAPFEGRFYVQPNHTDHDGRPWETAIWRLA